MRGEETQRITAGGDESRVRRGPRHAAPKKSLLTKLHIPAGKAIALAAMPTAVFVGMGLTPRLALADDSKDIPFAPGPCVTRSDDPDPSESPSPSGSPSESPSGSPSQSPAPGESPSAPDGTEAGAAEPGTGQSTAWGPDSEDADAPAGAEPEPKPTATATAKPAPTPAPAKSKHPLDPLGLGDALGDLLGIPGKETPATRTPTPSATPQRPDAAEPSAEPAPRPSSTQRPAPDSPARPGGPGGGNGAGGAAGAVVDDTEKAIREAAERAGVTVEELDDEAKGLDAHKDDDIPAGADGKEPFPCPTPDPEALAAAKEEQGIPLLPDDPWTLHSSLLTLRGLDYHGIVEVKTGSGRLKKALKFTATSVDIGDLHQTVVYPEGRTGHVQARAGSTSTIRDGEVTMYTEELKGNLFGLIPVTFSPRTPPPLNVPFAFFTEVEVTQAGQFGGTLTVPGLQNYITD
ncbi:hypothetical protein [Streptomyces lushanensis]|uniref:hypothetical protein n=1 Tax=Streptomyces lushanensis TaxID=1434255 RepID=UPI000832DA1D|nr:hypothetical protein [Streptomyces lushanensis]